MVALALASVSGVRAQTSEDSLPLVRVTLRDGAYVTGRMAGWDGGTLEVFDARTGAPRVLDRGAVERIEISRGRSRNFGKHFGISVLGASVLGGVVGAAAYEPCESTEFLGCFLAPESRGEAFGWGAALGAAVGVPIGIVLGLTIEKEDWAEYSPEQGAVSAVRVHPVVLGERFGLRGSVTLR